MSAARPVQAAAINADPELQRVLDIASHVGAASNDDVNVSYTSLLIGLLWSNDRVSTCIQGKLDELGARKTAVYAQRKMEESQRAPILAKVDSGEPASPRTDPTSISARTVLSEARSLATETGLPAEKALGTRHLAAVYFFRNPPGHNTQFHVEWRFDKEAWRREFSQFIASHYAQEAPAWSPVLGKYAPTTGPESDRVPGTLLGSFRFEAEAVGLLRALESKMPPLLDSVGLLEVLVAARAVPDCAAFADLAAGRLGITSSVTLPEDAVPFEDSGSSFAASHGFKNVLGRARSLALSTTGTETIGVRHMIASILVDPDSTANQKLVRSGVSLPLVRERLLKVFSRRWLNDDGPQWQSIMVGSTLPTIVQIYTDSADRGEDRLDVSRYARAFATVIAAQRVNPPFSVGIFGDWGSGKSFFMRLMSEHTQKLCALADKGEDGKRLFCQSVVPIRFNAWHYAESELLASLVQAILLGLRSAIVGSSGDSELMDAVLAKLEIAKVVRNEAEKRLASARVEQQESAGLLDQARQEAQQKAAAVQTVELRDVVGAVRKVLLPNLTVDDAVAVAEKYLGLEGLGGLKKQGQKTAGEVMAVVNDVRVTSARARCAWDWLLRAPVPWRELRLWVAAVLVLLAVGVAAAIRLHASWPAFYGLAINIAGVAALGARWAKRQLSTVSKGLDQFDEIRRQIDAALVEERSKTQVDLTKAQSQHEAAVAKVEQADVRLREAQIAIAKAEQDVRDSRSISRIAKLLEDRLTGKSYERYLGIVAAVRADFETLSDLMRGMRADGGVDVGKLQPVDRIVLYIDDLDRCPADKVVAVLEAIHLLLAFDLFVVVVGVDIRWAARSLVEKYPEHLTAGVYEGGKSNGAGPDGVTALDYLEKIFQIPFWLPPMEQDASRNMIAEMVPRVVEAGTKESGKAAVDSEELSPGQEGQTEHAAESSRAAVEEAGANAQSLVIEPEERNFMLQLAAAVGKSPRRLKRFVNTYRILKASLDKLQQETFVVKGGSQGEYRAAMALLAIVTGAPRSSLGMLAFLANCAESAPLSEFEAHVNQSPDSAEAKYAQAALEAYGKAEAGATVKVLRDWATTVTRFSFRSGRV
jgi:hypothetical protein